MHGARYSIVNNQPDFVYCVINPGDYTFTNPEFRTLLEDVKKPENKMVSLKFMVTQSDNVHWYTRDGVNFDALAAKVEEHGKQVRRTDGKLRQGQTVPIVGATPAFGEQTC